MENTLYSPKWYWYCLCSGHLSVRAPPPRWCIQAMGFQACEFPVLPACNQKLPAAFVLSEASLLPLPGSTGQGWRGSSLRFCGFASLLVMVACTQQLLHCCAPLSPGLAAAGAGCSGWNVASASLPVRAAAQLLHCVSAEVR